MDLQNADRINRITELLEGFVLAKNLLTMKSSLGWEIEKNFNTNDQTWSVLLTETYDEAHQESVEAAKIYLEGDFLEISFSERQLGFNLKSIKKDFLPYQLRIINYQGRTSERQIHGYIYLEHPEELIPLLGIITTLLEKNI